MRVNKPIVLNQEENKKGFSDEQTDKRIHEHLMNEKDEITIDDIRNVQTNVTSPATDMNTDMVDDKLIGDDLENIQVKNGDYPEIDSARDMFEK